MSLPQRQQFLRVCLRTQGDAFGRVVKDIQIVGVAKTGIGTIDDRAPCEMAVRVPVRRQDAGNLHLEGG